MCAPTAVEEPANDGLASTVPAGTATPSDGYVFAGGLENRVPTPNNMRDDVVESDVSPTLKASATVPVPSRRGTSNEVPSELTSRPLITPSSTELKLVEM